VAWTILLKNKVYNVPFNGKYVMEIGASPDYFSQVWEKQSDAAYVTKRLEYEV
jgi:hypothetical protein